MRVQQCVRYARSLSINIVPCELKVGLTGCKRLELGAECFEEHTSLFVLRIYHPLCEKVVHVTCIYMHLTDNNMRKATCMLNECAIVFYTHVTCMFHVT